MARRILFSYENLLPTTQADAEVFLSTAGALAARGHEAIVATPRPPDATDTFEREVLEFYGIDAPLEISAVPSFTKNLALQHVYHALHLPEHPAFARADFIYARNPVVVMRSLQAGQRVLMDHYRPWGDQFPALQPMFRRFMNHPRFLGLVVHSAYSCQSYRRLGVPEAKLRVVHNGFDPRRMQPVLSKAEARAKIGLPQDKRIVTYAGRINEKKGLEVILELARRMPEVMFVLVGSTGRGPIEIEAESQDNVRIVPWQTSSSISPYLYATDVLTIPPSTVIATILAWAMGSWDVGMCAVAVIASIVGGLFASLPWLNVKGRRRWLGFAAFAAVGFGIGLGVLLALHSATHLHLYLAAGTALATMGVLSIDLAGTTPWYGSYINRFHNEAHVDLVEDRCTGAAECVQVCPRNVLQMNGRRRKVEIRRPDQCIQCGACIVQCPEDALRFRYEDGRVVEAPTIRRTRMNMVGRRTVEVSN